MIDANKNEDKIQEKKQEQGKIRRLITGIANIFKKKNGEEEKKKPSKSAKNKNFHHFNSRTTNDHLSDMGLSGSSRANNVRKVSDQKMAFNMQASGDKSAA